MGLKEPGLRGSLRNVSVEIGAIPDSAILHWPVQEGSGSTVAEVLGEISGQSGSIQSELDWVQNSWWEDWALSQDDGGHILTGDWGSFGSNLTNDFTILITVETTDTSTDFPGLIGVQNSEDETRLSVRLDDTNGYPSFRLADVNRNVIQVAGETDIRDGGTYRLAYVKRGNSASDLEVWINGSEDTDQEQEDENFSNVSDFTHDVSIIGENREGSVVRIPESITVDNVIVCDAALSPSDIQSDYSMQPWSDD